ncbi:MAG TPA: ABC transporter permease [Acidimicrobiales bacterium]|nr:ABC transporter permease [Acidimicrobiales bacterium]
MILALRELRRSPRRFVTATVALTFLVVLLLFLGGLLDGLYRGSTGMLRAQRADVIVYSTDANDSIIRSRIDPALRAQVEGVAGVTGVDGLGLTLVGATVPGRRGLADTAVIGYERAPNGVPAPLPAGEAWADRRLAASGVHVGQTLRVGPEEMPIRVRGWVSDTNYLLQGALWVDTPTWRAVQDSSRPDARVEPGTFAVLVASGKSPAPQLAHAIDAATDGQTKTLTKGQAVLSSPGTREQKSTFAAIIGVTFLVVGLVVALFFVLLTIERTPLYGVLKALGASTPRLAAGVITQALVVGLVAFGVGELVTLGFAALLPAQIPLLLQPWRALLTLVGIVAAAVLGGTVSLRRVARVDPTTAIGATN